VFLTDTAINLIGELEVLDKKTKKMKPKGYLFPCPHTKKIQGIAVNALAHVVRRNMAIPVLVNGKPVFDKEGKPVTENMLGVADFTPHDLRRTAATFMSQLGFMDEVIDAVLNHTKQGIIRTYNLNRYDKEKQMALEAWERKLLSIISGSTSNVVNIQTGKRKAA
jgi:integrase